MLHHVDSLSQLLDRVCEALQLSATQHQSAVEKYEAVGRWLGGEGSPLYRVATAIYAQGSMAMGLTVRPGDETEHDLDLIFEVERLNLSPLDLHRIVEVRLRENRLYAARLASPAPPRCLRLIYAGDFHLDIVPARKDPARGKTAIEVPDRKLLCWVPNNPIAYQQWFESCSVRLTIMEKAEPQPVPGLVPSGRKPPLKRAIQLLKRNRDIVFVDGPGTPSSILLTTMAASVYNGEPQLVEALANILACMEDAVRSASPQRIIVRNPTNADEDLCAKFTEEQYARFVGWILGLREGVRRLMETRGLDKVADMLKTLFGEKITTTVVKSFMATLNESRQTRQLRYGPSGLSIVSGTIVPRHIFHGHD